MKKVLIFGTFDRFHPGHESVIQQASKLGDELCVVIARDQTVKEVKGHLPSESEDQRSKKLQNHELVSKVVLGNLKDKYQVIEELQPDIIALGYDQRTFTEGLKEELKKRGIEAEIIRLHPHKPEKYKTSLMKES